MKHFVILRVVVAISILAMTLVVGCASTKPEGGDSGVTEAEFDLDELLGEPQGEQAEPQQPAPSDEEGEVLRLLGITKEEKEPAAQPSTEVTVPQQEDLQAKVGELEKRVEDRDVELAALRSDLVAKEDQISQLEQELRDLQTMPTVKATRAEVAPTSFKGRYEAARQTYERRQYQRAISLFEGLLNEDPNNKLSDNCQYWIGECYYGLGDYDQAILEFQKVFGFPETNKAADAQLKLGICYRNQGDTVRAKEEFQRVLIDFPDSEYVSKAQAYLNQLP